MAARGGEADVIADLAFPLPFTVISEMLGMPEGDRDRLRDWSHAMVKTLDPIISRRRGAAPRSTPSGHMIEHVLAAIEWKRREPADDLLTKLIVAEDEGDMLTEDELVAQVVLLYIAGHETTVNLIGNGTLALLRHPDQLDAPPRRSRARRERDRGAAPLRQPGAVLPPDHRSRRCGCATSTIEPGVFVLTCLGSANRDPEFWGPTADALDLGRDGRRRSTCRSAAACTTASGPRSRASRVGSRSRRWSGASRSWRWPSPTPNRPGTVASCCAASTASPSRSAERARADRRAGVGAVAAPYGCRDPGFPAPGELSVRQTVRIGSPGSVEAGGSWRRCVDAACARADAAGRGLAGRPARPCGARVVVAGRPQPGAGERGRPAAGRRSTAPSTRRRCGCGRARGPRARPGVDRRDRVGS